MLGKLRTSSFSIASGRERRSVSGHGRRDRDGHDHDHALSGGRCRDPRGPNVPHASASLLGSGHSADGSSMPLDKEDVPIVLGPTCNGDPLVPNIRLPR